MKLYKLTDHAMQTYGGCQWELGVERSAPGKWGLCTDGWLHAYTDPIISIMMNPIHAGFYNPRLFLAKGRGASMDDHGLKVGVQHLTLLEEMPVPVITIEQRVRFGILCAMQVCKSHSWRSWAQKWLDGRDRRPAIAGEMVWHAARNDYLCCARAARSAEVADRLADESSVMAARAAICMAEVADYLRISFDLPSIAQSSLHGPISGGPK